MWSFNAQKIYQEIIYFMFDNNQSITLLITASPNSPKAWQALDYAKEKLENQQAVVVFFYGDGAYTANALRWQSADVADVAEAWAALAHTYQLTLSVCVSAALARGVTDSDNAKRHGLSGNNLKPPFVLVGLSDLAIHIGEGVLQQF